MLISFQLVHGSERHGGGMVFRVPDNFLESLELREQFEKKWAHGYGQPNNSHVAYEKVKKLYPDPISGKMPTIWESGIHGKFGAGAD